jgi:hypothetical protein
MFARMIPLLVIVCSLALVVSRAGAIDEKTHEGKVVSVAEGRLVMTDKDGGNEHTHQVPATAKVTVDGKAAKLTDLRKNDMVTVTVDGSGKVSSVAANHSAK